MNQIIDRVLAEEIDVVLVDGDQISVPDATPEKDVAALIECKQEIIRRLMEAQQLATECLCLAALHCNQLNDGPAVREAMRADVPQTPPRLLPDLLAHFRKVTVSGTIRKSGGAARIQTTLAKCDSVSRLRLVIEALLIQALFSGLQYRDEQAAYLACL